MWGARAPRCQPPAPQPSRVPQTLDHSQKCYSRVYEIIKSDLGICGARAPRCQSSSTRCQPPAPQPSRVPQTLDHSQKCYSRVYEIIKSDLGICGARAPRCQSSSTRWQPPTLQFSRVLESPSDTRANSKMLFSRTRNHNSQMRSPKIRRPTGSAASEQHDDL